MTEVNIPLLRKAVEWVEAQEALPLIDREWDQRQWITGGAYRVYELTYEFNQRGYRKQPGEEFHRQAEIVKHHCGTAYCVAGRVASWQEPAFNSSTVARLSNGTTREISEYARELLGLSTHEAGRLFFAANTASDVRRIAEEIAGEKL